MKPLILKVIADGRVTIPKGLREKHGIRKGDHVEALYSAKGELRILLARTIKTSKEA